MQHTDTAPRFVLLLAALAVSDRVDTLLQAAEAGPQDLTGALEHLQVSQGRFAWRCATAREDVLRKATPVQLQEAHAALAEALEAGGEPQLAVWHRAQARPDAAAPAQSLALAEALLAAGSAKAAGTVAHAVLSTYPDSARALLSAGRAALAAGDVEKARELLLRASLRGDSEQLALATEHLEALDALDATHAAASGAKAAAEVSPAAIAARMGTLMACTVTEAGRRAVDALAALRITTLQADSPDAPATEGTTLSELDRGTVQAYLSFAPAPPAWPWTLVPGAVAPFEESFLQAEMDFLNEGETASN